MPLTQVFVSISDPRSARQVRHDLSELLTVAVCAVLCSADEFSDIEAWAKERIDWLRGFLVLEHGIPSHDTFGRVFAALNPREFEAAFRRWVGQLVPALGPDAVVAIDGKTSRRSTTKAAANPLHLVRAFAADVGLVLGQTATAEKSNEITAIPELLATLALQGCVVTLDAMGAQTGIAKAIREGGADYVLCVKDNHPKLVESFLLAQAGVGGALTPISTTESREDGHGRTEVRRCWAFDAVDRLYKADQWPDLKSLAIVERERTVGAPDQLRAPLLHQLPARGCKADCSCSAQPLGGREPPPLVSRRPVQRRPVDRAHRIRGQQPRHRAPHRDEPAAPEHLAQGQHQDQTDAGRHLGHVPC